MHSNLIAQEFVDIYDKLVFPITGYPECIVADRDVLFTSNIVTQWAKKNEIRLDLSSAYHPQTDGTTEATNKAILQLIRAYTLEGKNWLAYLPEIQFKLTSRKDESRRKSPFEILYGSNPRSTPHLWPHLVTTYTPPEDRQHTTQENLAAAKRKQFHYANKRMTSPPKLESG